MDGFLIPGLRVSGIFRAFLVLVGGVLEEVLQVGLHKPPRRQGVHGGVRLDLGGVEEQLPTSHQPRLDAHPDDLLEEAAEDREPVAFPDPGEGGVVGQGLVEVVAHVPSQVEAVGHRLHESTFRTETLEEEDELQLEEDHRVDRSPAAPGVERAHQLPHEREVDPLLQAPVEVVLGDEEIQREVFGQPQEVALFDAHHGGRKPRLT